MGTTEQLRLDMFVEDEKWKRGNCFDLGSVAELFREAGLPAMRSTKIFATHSIRNVISWETWLGLLIYWLWSSANRLEDISAGMLQARTSGVSCLGWVRVSARWTNNSNNHNQVKGTFKPHPQPSLNLPQQDQDPAIFFELGILQ
jgi:hypothetical protein